MRYTNILWKEKRNLLYEIIERIIFIILLLHSRDSHSSNINKKKTNIFLQKTRALKMWIKCENENVHKKYIYIMAWAIIIHYMLKIKETTMLKW